MHDELADAIVGEELDAAAVGIIPGSDRPTAKQRALVQREIDRMLDQLAPERPPARGGEAALASIQRHRAPRRCVLQGAERAVSVSWFPSNGSDDTLGEVQIIEWKGVVSLPGSATRAAGGAVAVRQSLLYPVELGAAGWAWRPEGGGAPIGTASLVEYCQRLLEMRHDG